MDFLGALLGYGIIAVWALATAFFITRGTDQTRSEHDRVTYLALGLLTLSYLALGVFRLARHMA